MKKTNEILLEKYFKGVLNSEEQLEFQKLLDTDKEFSEEYKFQNKLKNVIITEERNDLKKFLSVIENNKKKKNYSFYYLAIAAGFTILVSISLFNFLNRPPDYNQLYITHFEVYPNVIAPTVRDSNVIDNTTLEAFRLYDDKNYQSAAVAFNTIFEETGEDYAYFYYAVSLMANENTEQAINAFKSHQWSEPENYNTVTDWYIGLGYLKLKNKEKATEYILKVAYSKMPLATRAREILRKLN
jgi:hypothetical protein